MTLGQRVAELRIRKKASLQDVADHVGVSKAHIWQIEKGRADNPALGLVERLADYFGVSMSYLIGEHIGAPSADVELAKLFRQAQMLDDRERQIISDLMASLLRQKTTKS